jgi:hypothetical protein
MWRRAQAILVALECQPRALAALARAFVLMDLRQQHFAKATATSARHVISPLFWVVGQCLTLSAASSLVLFLRVDVFFFALVGVATSMAVLATTVLVEFHEIVLGPHDADVLGHRPVSARTYSAARFANLMFYVALVFVALNVFPMIVGARLRDAGWWYAPAYLIASLGGSLVTVCGVILVLAAAGSSRWLEAWKEILAWTQIVLILVVGYGAQLMFRDQRHRLDPITGGKAMSGWPAATARSTNRPGGCPLICSSARP